MARWKEFAKSKGRDLEFEYWGESELFDRLSKKENEGRFYFWFNKEEFTDKWFKDQLDVSVRNLDRRYTPELNFDLPIAKF
ncbi:MAG: hypothetical protein IPI12_15520 [Ignavibacteriales bacterium]|nr:hypothetical protein [Ignavibacteriales bacterium]